jgi:uncharacterized membrane protein YdjX (TVP38/TMEM64 family)
MRIARYRHIVAIALASVATVGAYVWFIRSPYFETFAAWSEAHPAALFFSLLSLKIAAIVWPPIPGSVLTFGAIPIIGWFRAYLADALGSIVGSTLAYWIARRWGMRLVAHVLDKASVGKLGRVQIPHEREFEAVFLLRILGSGALTEVLCYAAGLFRIRYHNFIFASVLSHAAVAIPLYYFGRGVFGESPWTAALALLAFLLVLLMLRKRYFVGIRDYSGFTGDLG